MMDIHSPPEDHAARRFYRELENERFMTTTCRDCDYLFFPPRIICPRCLSDKIEWLELSGRGNLYAYTQQHYAMFFTKPVVVGLVDLEEGCGRVFSVIDIPWEECRIGMPVEVSFLENPRGIKLHKFIAVKEG